MEPFLITVPPRPEADPAPTNAHPGQEFNHMLEGKLQIVIEDHSIELAPGDSIYFDATHPHGMKALGGKPARFLAVIL